MGDKYAFAERTKRQEKNDNEKSGDVTDQISFKGDREAALHRRKKRLDRSAGSGGCGFESGRVPSDQFRYFHKDPGGV